MHNSNMSYSNHSSSIPSYLLKATHNDDEERVWQERTQENGRRTDTYNNDLAQFLDAESRRMSDDRNKSGHDSSVSNYTYTNTSMNKSMSKKEFLRHLYSKGSKSQDKSNSSIYVNTTQTQAAHTQSIMLF